MSGNRITYRNLAEIFVMEIEDKNIEVGTLKYYLNPFNKYVIIKNIYKYPERVKEYAEACQFTNIKVLTAAAQVLRSVAPISNVIEDVVIPALNESFKRKIVLPPVSSVFTIFTYHDPQTMEYYQYEEAHADGPTILPLRSEFPHINHSIPMSAPGLHFEGAESIAGILFLDETYGTEILVNKNVSYYHSKTTGIWGAPPTHNFNDNYYPEGNDSHYEHIITIGGEYNSAVFYYGAVSHRPHDFAASDEDLKRGRLIQNIYLDDVTGTEGK